MASDIPAYYQEYLKHCAQDELMRGSAAGCPSVPKSSLRRDSSRRLRRKENINPKGEGSPLSVLPLNIQVPTRRHEDDVALLREEEPGQGRRAGGQGNDVEHGGGQGYGEVHIPAPNRAGMSEFLVGDPEAGDVEPHATHNYP